MPIRTRLALLFVAGIAAVATIGGFVFVHTISNGLRSSIVTTLQTRADAISQQLPEAGSGQQQGPGQSSSIGNVDENDSITQLIGSNSQVTAASGLGTAAPLLTSAQLAQARHQGLFTERSIHNVGPYLLYATASDSKTVVVVGESLATVNEAVGRVEIGIIVGGSVAVVLAGIAAWFIAGAALAPVERMRRQAAEISEHDTEAELAVPGTRDEIAALARTMNGLLGRLQSALSRQQGFVSAAGHELRTPLSILRAELELAERPGRSKAELSAAIREAAREADHVIQLSEDLLLLSRSDEADPLVSTTAQDIVPLVTSFLDAFGSHARTAGVELKMIAPSELVIPVDAKRFRQIMDNLLDNALRLSPSGGTVTVRIYNDPTAATIEVLDEGPGFPIEYLPRAFDRFGRPDGSRSRDHAILASAWPSSSRWPRPTVEAPRR